MARVIAFVLFAIGALIIGFIFSGIAAYRRASAEDDNLSSDHQRMIDVSCLLLAGSAISFVLCFAVFGLHLAGLSVIFGPLAIILLVGSVTLALLGDGIGKNIVLVAHSLIALWAIALSLWATSHKSTVPFR